MGTGLLDKYLFQGVSGGSRIQLPHRVTGYFNVGQSSASTDKKDSWNTMYGASMSRIWKTELTIDARYSKFDSSFASGVYRTIDNFARPWRPVPAGSPGRKAIIHFFDFEGYRRLLCEMLDGNQSWIALFSGEQLYNPARRHAGI